MARPRNPLLSRERIVSAALDLVDAEGLAALSTRRLAAGLGVSGPSLYNHFATKDALLDAVVDHVVGEVDLSMWQGPGVPEATGWSGALLAWARSYRAALVAHPNLVPVLAQGPGRRANALRLADAVFGGLVDAGWPKADATRIGALMRYFVFGSALGSFAAGFVDDRQLYSEGYPHLGEAHLLAERQRQVDEGAFEAGLSALVEGLTLQYARLGAPGRNG
ncbi:TetR/AcrR family transcriptional regulator [Streptacidiphilus sp. PB12-B1b]|uniref:TetR/AcrR family transcriptional regulator n=1 Tax=Streptacidiphilus sp. PB12-B1b TaxID=2705012 RepID=UPI0015FA34E3|nr:TetR/AcrR family transcriptional regulator [Streptacidiphilus sp. PB12-B1b]QMU76255.1 TetR/AcrR family transcriptional regulator [Streptacidiphilus sp. PB12-B1b]